MVAVAVVEVLEWWTCLVAVVLVLMGVVPDRSWLGGDCTFGTDDKSYLSPFRCDWSGRFLSFVLESAMQPTVETRHYEKRVAPANAPTSTH